MNPPQPASPPPAPSTVLATVLCGGAAAVLGMAVGYLSWGPQLMPLALVVVLPALWSLARSRTGAGLIFLGYYLAAARSMPHGTHVFFGATQSAWLGYALWLLTAALLALPWWLLWRPRMGLQSATWRLPLVLALTALPPLGLFGWAHPMTAAGVLLPGAGWWGLLALLAWMMAVCGICGQFEGLRRVFRWELQWRNGAFIAVLALCPLAALVYSFAVTPSSPAEPLLANWIGADTQYGGVPLTGHPEEGGLTYLMRAYKNNQRMMQQASDTLKNSPKESSSTPVPSTAVVLFPESMAGPWNDTTAALWEPLAAALKSRGATVLVGAEVLHPGGQYDNAIVAIEGETTDPSHPKSVRDAAVKYRQRMPVPFAMWTPFSGRGAIAHWFAPGVFDLGGTRVAGLICYEQLLVWPVLISMAHGAQAIVAPANMWWSRDTDLPAIQKTAVRAWARLFGVPLVSAFNT